ncbi:hypothetical protein G6F55_007346 [Rhizopus delemar]|uniref:Uncharacterized protein n=2 Tax=Rhizopus TaxID=4842 RepID=A0A9P6YRX8_9FUNG|nr:hypothetical protein G6F36_010582 [Rhizopus arrhizus]KAG1454935.1 hypothetical protein G6F55_007346 [Rhizopus delemar]KAG1517620.1 hypothetical protein G6F52_009199 [Rhizopus delemar]KAG1534380.1 hypothetical protein G6F51_012126 [Rhizopus arrhizus]KAG1539949.1 hypothetical protein G6F49_012252 [Rhizopus delemar]
MVDEHDYFFRLVLTGDSGVGKSNVMSRFARNEFDLVYRKTIGVDFTTKTLGTDNHTVRAQIWDTAGQERFRTIVSSYYRGVAGAFIVYDITSRSSFENVHIWLREIREYTDSTAVIMLVGNKVDLSKFSRVVETEEGRLLAEEEELLFIETSALDAASIDAAFIILLSKICSNFSTKTQGCPESTDN